jgi:hypothetical protein
LLVATDQLQKDKIYLSSNLREAEQKIKELVKTCESLKETNSQHSKQLLTYQQLLQETKAVFFDKLYKECVEFQTQLKRYTEDQIQAYCRSSQYNSSYEALTQEATKLAILIRSYRGNQITPELWSTIASLTRKIFDLIATEDNRLVTEKKVYEWQAKYYYEKLVLTEDLLAKSMLDRR